MSFLHIFAGAVGCPSSLLDLRAVHEGRQLLFMMPAHGNLQPVIARAAEFSNCTGSQIDLHEVSYAAWSDELALDLGTTVGTGSQIFHAYMIKSAWFSEYAERGALEPLNDYIQSAGASLEWTDLFPVVRQYLVTHNHQAYVMPNDADFVMMYARMDLLSKSRISLPSTWEDLINLAKLYHGKDLNGDNIADYGICWPANPVNFGMIAMAIHASVLQSKGVSQGFFFDTETGRPLWNNAASAYAFDILHQLLELSPFAVHGPNHHNFKGHARDFMAGRCAILVGMPGLFKSVMFAGGVRRTDPYNGSVVWEPDEPPAHARMVGSTQVLDPATGSLVPCTRKRCPFATGEPLVNRPAFFGSGGFATCIGSHAPHEVKQLAFDFFSYLNEPSQSLPDVAAGGFMDPYRASHVSEASMTEYESAGWSRQEASRLFEIERMALQGQVESSAMDLRIPHRDEFIFEPSLLEERTEDLLNPKGWEYRTYLYLGWVLSPEPSSACGPTKTCWVRTDHNISVEDLMSSLEESWSHIMTEQGGSVLATLQTYRSSLSLPPLGQEAMCNHHRDDYEAQGGSCNRLDVASTGQQRVFWTLSLVCHSLGLLLSLLVLHEFVYNSALRPPHMIATSFLAIAIPDSVFSLVYFIFSFSSLLRGHELEATPCKSLAFVTYMIVIATFCGPVIVSFVTWLKLNRIVEGRVNWALSTWQFALIILVPWLFGVVFALIVAANEHLGSYRGLYCYNNDWAHFDTGGLTMLTFLASTALTVLFYALAAFAVSRPISIAKDAAAAKDAARAIGRRGGYLVACYFSTWILFTANGFSNWLGSTPSIPLETIAALVATLPSVVDALVLLSLDSVRQDLLRRLVLRFGMAGIDGGSAAVSPITAKSLSKKSKGNIESVLSISGGLNSDDLNSGRPQQQTSGTSSSGRPSKVDVHVITRSSDILNREPTIPVCHIAPAVPDWSPPVAPSEENPRKPPLRKSCTFAHFVRSTERLEGLLVSRV